MIRKSLISTLQVLALPLLLALIIGCSPSPIKPATPTAWKLDTSASQVSLFVIKKNAIGETFTLELTSGAVQSNGQASVLIDLQSIQSGIPIRNERMQKHLFETGNWAVADVSTQLDTSALSATIIGSRTEISSNIDVSFHELSNTYEGNFIVTKLTTSRVLVQSAQPVAVVADEFGLTSGLAKLQELAHLPSITPVVAVSFSLIFDSE